MTPLRANAFFYVDTTRHWPRTIVLLADGLACMTTLVLCLIPGKPKSAEEDETPSQSEGRHSMGNDLAGLGLDGEDQTKS